MEENLNQNIVSSTEPVVVTPILSTNQPPFGSWWKVGILVVGVLLAGSITYAGYQYSKKQTPLIPQPTPTPVVVVTPTPDPTANWKTYTTNELGLILKYPPGWYVDNAELSNYWLRIQNYDPATAPARGYEPVADKGRFAMSVSKWDIENGKFKTVEELKNRLNLNKECFFMGDPAGVKLVFNEKERTINNIMLYSRDTRCSEEPTSLTSETYLLDGKGNVIKIIPQLDVNAGKGYFDQILSTFQFLN